MIIETESIRNFLSEQSLNQAITITIDNNYSEEIKTLERAKISEIDRKSQESYKTFFLCIKSSFVEYYYHICKGNKLDKEAISVDFYTIDNQHWQFDENLQLHSKMIQIFPEVLLSSNPLDWSLEMMFLQIAKWGELTNNPLIKRNYYLYSLWLLTSFSYVDEGINDDLTHEILTHPSISHLKLYRDFALDEYRFCQEARHYCDELKVFPSPRYLWFCLQYSQYYFAQNNLVTTSKEVKQYLKWQLKTAQSYTRLISKKNLEGFRRERNHLFQEDVAYRKEFQDWRLGLRQQILSYAFDKIYQSSKDKNYALVRHTRNYLKSIKTFCKLASKIKLCKEYIA